MLLKSVDIRLIWTSVDKYVYIIISTNIVDDLVYSLLISSIETSILRIDKKEDKNG